MTMAGSKHCWQRAQKLTNAYRLRCIRFKPSNVRYPSHSTLATILHILSPTPKCTHQARCPRDRIHLHAAIQSHS